MTNISNTPEFQQVQGIITLHRIKALQVVNNENLLTAWEVGAFVSNRLKNAAWGSKTVMQLSEYLRTQDPTLRGFSKRNIYNMVSFYDTYSSLQFIELHDKLKLHKFVQPLAAQIEEAEIIQSTTGQLENSTIVSALPRQIVQTASAQFPKFLEITTLSNHFQILNTCKTIEEQIFYILYSYKEKLNARELQRCLKNNTFASLMGAKHNLSKGLKDMYPQAVPMLKDTLFVDFLGITRKSSRQNKFRSITTKKSILMSRISKTGLKSHIFITVCERSVAYGTSGKSSTSQADERAFSLPQVATCGYENQVLTD
ncbi:MAG: DUF1016 N-terminal domain-containing protein [Bacteroidales bacterium]|jgi:hypothetical protein|nr:DUF1016 N-terminal domain-containing protein [Bacteroidales bacterium]